MVRRVRTLLPLLATALAAVLLSTGSLAFADKEHEHSGAQEHQSSHKSQEQQSSQKSEEHRSKNHRYSAWDEEWLKMSIEGDLFEIQGGQIAQQKGVTQAVKDMGARLVADHTKSLKDATDVAKELGIEVPTEPSPSQQWELKVVSSFFGPAFDKWYADLEVQDHIQDIQEAQDEVDKGRNRKVRNLAKEDIPTLQEHLKMAQDALAAAGGNS
jgi:predicted outer membrane protein